MDIQKQLCFFEQAQKLNELGIKGGTCCYINENGDIDEYPYEGYLPAFTVAELGCMLGPGTGMCSFHHDKWKAEYEHDNIKPEEKNKGTGTTRFLVHCNTEAEARAAFLIYSLENGFLKPEDCNQRLSA